MAPRSHLTNDPYEVRRATGFDPFEHSLPQKLAVDGYREAMPLMGIVDGAKPLLFMKEIDRTNVEHLRHQGARFVWHSPYFSFGGLRGPTDAYPDLASAVQAEMHGDVTFDSGMSVSLVRQLQDTLGGGEEPLAPFYAPRNHYVVARRDVTEAFARGRRELSEAAAPLIAALGDPRLWEWVSREPPDRFALLDRLMEEASLDALVAASPLGIQDLTGIPMRSIGEEAWAVYPVGSQVVHLLSHRELPVLELPLAQRPDATSVRRLAGGPRLGFEEVALSLAAWNGFGLAELDASPATPLLRRWRELRSWEDVAAYVVGARITREAIDSALTFVEGELAAGRHATELHAHEHYRSKVGSFLRKHRLPVRVRTYFTHTHAGNRSHFPASATSHRISPHSSLKIDGGLEIYDPRGLFVAVSDVTRSAVGQSHARDFYQLLDDALLQGAIATCRAGVKGSDVFAGGLTFLEPYRSDLIEGAFMPPSDAPMTELFRRNIGHLIGKQEPATVEFSASHHGSLESGMIAAAEFQWPYADYCIGVEDVLLVTDEEPVNLTRPVIGGRSE